LPDAEADLDAVAVEAAEVVAVEAALDVVAVDVAVEDVDAPPQPVSIAPIIAAESTKPKTFFFIFILLKY